MKKYVIFLLLFICILSVSAKNNLQLIASSVACNWNDLPKEERISRATSKIIYRLTVKKIDDLKNERPYLLSECIRNRIESDGNISEADILAMLKSEEKFVLLPFVPMGTEPASYQKISIGPKNIGEFVFESGSDGLLVSGSFVYSLRFLDGETLNEFWINTTFPKGSMDALESLPGIFRKEGGMWKWKSRDSLRELSALMQSHDDRLPEALLQLQEAWEKIIHNLEVDGKKIDSV